MADRGQPGARRPRRNHALAAIRRAIGKYDAAFHEAVKDGEIHLLLAHDGPNGWAFWFSLDDEAPAAVRDLIDDNTHYVHSNLEIEW